LFWVNCRKERKLYRPRRMWIKEHPRHGKGEKRYEKPKLLVTRRISEKKRRSSAGGGNA